MRAMSRFFSRARSILTLLRGGRPRPAPPRPAPPVFPVADRPGVGGDGCVESPPTDKSKSTAADVWVIQADDRPFTIHRESKPLSYDAGDDTPAMMRSLNAGSLSRRWDSWSSSFVINRLKCRIAKCAHEVIAVRDGDHPDRHVTWAKIRLISDFMRDRPEVGVVAFLDSDAFIRDEERFMALVDALIADPEKHGILSRDPIMPKNTFINTGCMILKNNAFSRAFLDSVWQDADRQPRYRREWPHEQFAASAFVQSHRKSFYICRTAVLNTPCGQIVRHSWHKELFNELVEDEFKAAVAKMCFPAPAAPTLAPPFDLQALLDP